MRCEDCGIGVDLDQEHWSEHEGFCCDCFDEFFGMPPHKRVVLREGSSPQLVANHIKYWKSIEEKKKNKKESLN